jgi:hypothetical protein
MLALLLPPLLAGCPPRPCPAHPSVTYCPTNSSAGQCDQPMPHAACPAGPCPPGPPPPPPMHCTSVKLVKQLSSAKCIEGKTFGCNATGYSMWTENCRGDFVCNGNGATFACSVDGPGRHICQCSGMPPPRPPGLPAFHACADPDLLLLPFCNTSLGREARLDDLMSRLSRQDKIGLLTPSDPHSDCGGQMGGVPKIGLPGWHWLTEANTNIATGCIGPGVCSTIFVGPEGMAASFNRTSWRLKGSVLGTEMRVFNHFGGGTPPSLTGYGPNLNIVRSLLPLYQNLREESG